MKKFGVIVGVLAVVVIGGIFMLSRRSPVDESQSEVLEPTPIPVSEELATSPSGSSAGRSPAASPVSAEATMVLMTASGFSPAKATATAGSTVTFTNNDTESHQVSSNPHPVHTSFPPLNGPVLQPGESFTVTFSKAGTHQYHDHLNPADTGTIVVE